MSSGPPRYSAGPSAASRKVAEFGDYPFGDSSSIKIAGVSQKKANQESYGQASSSSSSFKPGGGIISGRRVKGLSAAGRGKSSSSSKPKASGTAAKQEVIMIDLEEDMGVKAQQPPSATSAAPPPGDDDGSDEPPKAKRAKTTKGKGKAEAEDDDDEKRLSRFRKSCPKAVLERLDRVRSQRMYLVDRERGPDDMFEIFKVLGSTGNTYTVTVALTPKCDCPDGVKNGTCKHIIFVMLKVLQASESGHVWYQKSLLSTELADLFAHAPPSPQQSALASGAVRAGYRQAFGKEPEADPFKHVKGSGGLPDKKLPEEGDDCPICYDELEADVAGLHFCLVMGGCGKALHKDCAQQWVQTKQVKREVVTCVWCRSSWASQAPPQLAQEFTVNEGYLNFGNMADMSNKRDTSSYYHGPRKGEKYNWQTLSQRYR